MSFEAVARSELGPTISAFERSLTTVSSQVVLEMGWMTELVATLFAHKPRLVHVNEFVVIKTMVAGEGRVADIAHVGLDTGVCTVMVNETAQGTEGSFTAYSTPEVVRVFPCRLFKLFDKIEGQFLLIFRYITSNPGSSFASADSLLFNTLLALIIYPLGGRIRLVRVRHVRITRQVRY
jgi:hypothetical protein